MRGRGLVAALLLVAAGAAAVAAPAGRTVEVRASKRGFEPSQLTLRRGETARIVLSSADVEHCFAIDALRVEKRVLPGRTTALELTPERAGSFPFHCCLHGGEGAGDERGELTVVE